MAKITTSLPVSVEENNGYQKYTREKTITQMSIAAPTINYFPSDFWIPNCSFGSMKNVITKHSNFIHYDFNNIGYTSGMNLLYIPIYNCTDFKEGQKYTLSYRFMNIKGTYDATKMSFDWNLNGSMRIKSGIFPQERILTITFTAEKKMTFIAWGYGNNWWQPRDISFDLQILGLTEGEVPITHSYNTFLPSPKISTSNTYNILGKYNVSRDIRRHIKQLERGIVKDENVFNITWR